MINASLASKNILWDLCQSRTTGAGMTDTILHQLQDMPLLVENMRSQGYDNGSNMKGKENGVQRRILDINPRALFVPCSAHSLNLVVNDAGKCCLEATAFFNLVQHVYVYFSASTRRWEVLKRHVPSMTVKPLSDTRWESHINALKSLRYQLGNIVDALIEISDDISLTGSSGNSSRVEARSLANNISKFKFIVSLVVWYDILFEINITRKKLQGKDYDIHDAVEQLKETKKYLVNCRNDEEFEKILITAQELAEELGISAELEPEPVHIRRRRKQFTYEADDELIQNPKQKFKVNFYFAVLDVAIQSVEQRFTQMHVVSSMFGFLYDIHNLQTITSKEVMEHCLKLEKALQHGDDKDIDAADLCSELQFIARRVEKRASPQDILKFICKKKLADSVPNVFIALRILLTLPVSVASGERNFSKLKLIKNYLRSTMTQDWIVGLSTLSIEHEIAEKLDLKHLVSTFAKAKARKSNFNGTLVTLTS
ncbi:zinc finger MYM-type protein 1-like [Homarus americanus]|uniref:zinc finger MYM-type protein 1-like n=1 Tax=Homarus americanus TaxID=6706 RepID=UPI001C473564|nr:zinc finger MYM-type protein 1-like [Homarus americanus]